MSERTRSVIDYIIACVNDFSDAHGMSVVSAYDYLNAYGGVSFLERNYDIEHSYPIEETVLNLGLVCRGNGGTL